MFSVLIFATLLTYSICNSELNPNNPNNLIVKVNKCCESNEIYLGSYCVVVNKTNQWHPMFTSEKGQSNLQINYT